MKVEDAENGVSSSSPFTKSSASDVDEEGQNFERKGINLSNRKKVVTKGYTSPTTYASSEAIGRSKTILSGSESINNITQMQTGSGLDPSSFKGALSSRRSGSLSHKDSALDKSKESSVNDGLSTDEYDPLTNYLSPRPKFLRYRPHRSREIFLRQQNEVGEEIFSGTALDGEQKVLFSPGSSSEEISENEQEEEKEEDREEIEEGDEEFDEDKSWTLKGVFKIFTLLMAAALYATYLSSMSMSSHGLGWDEAPSNGTWSLQYCKNEAEFAWNSDFFDPMDERRVGWREEEVKMIDEMVENIFFHQEEVEGGFTDQSAEVAERNDGEREVRGFEGGGKEGQVDLAEGEELECEDPFHCKEPTETHPEIAAHEELAKTKIDSPEKTAGSVSNIFDSIRMLRERNFYRNGIIENMNTQKFILPSSLAFLLMLIVSVVCYRSKKKTAFRKQQLLSVEALELLENEDKLEKISPPALKACSETVIPQENDAILSREGRPSALTWLKEEKDISDQRYYNSRAPTVELLGEFVVRGETGNTLKNRMIESKDSNNLVSVEECPAYSRPALSELSNSPSYGSFSAEKIVKKEVGGGGDLKAISTPVRRSSRIKNRAAMSP